MNPSGETADHLRHGPCSPAVAVGDISLTQAEVKYFWWSFDGSVDASSHTDPRPLTRRGHGDMDERE
jgi:hypothetical protein